MTSIYEKIESPKELVQLVAHQGLSTRQEDICRAQDIFGRASIKDLVELANDNGIRNSNGEKDPQGAWSDGSKGFSQTFYSVLFTIWNWEDATRFYNKHSNFFMIDKLEELKRTERELKELLLKCEEMDKEIKSKQSKIEEACENANNF